MLYTEKELDKVEDILEGDRACKLISSLDNLIEGDLPLVSEMIEDCISNYRKKSMCISNVNFVSDKGDIVDKGFAIEAEDSNGDFEVVAYYLINKHGGVPQEMVLKLMELSYLGYILKTYRDQKVLVHKI